MRFFRLGLLGITLLLLPLSVLAGDVTMVFDGTGQITQDQIGIFTFGAGPQPVHGTFRFDDAEPGSCSPSYCSYPVLSCEMTIGGPGGQDFTATMGAEIWTQLSPPGYGVLGWLSSSSAYVPYMAIEVAGPAPVSGILPDFDLTDPELTGTSITVDYVDDLYRRSSFEGVVTGFGEQSVAVSETSWGRVKRLYR